MTLVLNNYQSTFPPGNFNPIHGVNSQLWTNKSQTSVSSLDLISKLCKLFLWMPGRHSEPSKCKAECYTTCSWKGGEGRQTESGVLFVFCFSVLTNENCKIQALPNKGYVEVCLLRIGSYWLLANPCSSHSCAKELHGAYTRKQFISSLSVTAQCGFVYDFLDFCFVLLVNPGPST